MSAVCPGQTGHSRAIAVIWAPRHKAFNQISVSASMDGQRISRAGKSVSIARITLNCHGAFREQNWIADNNLLRFTYMALQRCRRK